MMVGCGGGGGGLVTTQKKKNKSYTKIDVGG